MIVAMVGTVWAAPPAQRLKMGPVAKGPGTLTAARKFLQGRWDLVSYEIFRPGEAPIQLKGGGTGTLIYDDYGNLEMNIKVDEPTGKLLEEAGIPTTNGRLTTKGRTVIDLQGRTLVFVLDGQPAFGQPAGPLALNRPRHWEVDESTLTLTTKADDGKPLSVSRWKKLP
jgi:hypothetical protein